MLPCAASGAGAAARACCARCWSVWVSIALTALSRTGVLAGWETGILISGAVLAVLKDRVVVRDRGSVTVKGRRQPVEIYELTSLMEP